MTTVLFRVMLALLVGAPIGMASAHTPPPTDRPASQAAKPDQTVTIVGCLVDGKTIVPAADRPAGAAVTADVYYVRTPAVAVPVGTTITVGKPGTTDTTTSAGKPAGTALYRVTGLAREQLQPHVGHRVELRGTLSNPLPEAQTRTKTVPMPEGGKTTVETRPEIAGEIRTAAITMVSATCP